MLLLLVIVTLTITLLLLSTGKQLKIGNCCEKLVYYLNKNNSMKRGEGIVLKNRSLDQEESVVLGEDLGVSIPFSRNSYQHSSSKKGLCWDKSKQRANTKVKVTVGDIEKKDKEDIEALASHDGKDPT